MKLDVCGICLSHGRHLKPLGTASLARVDVNNYHNVTVETVSQITMCWECQALFSKTAILYERVNKAYAILEGEGTVEKGCENFKSMSTLSQKTTIGFDYKFVYKDSITSLTLPAETDHALDIHISPTQNIDYSEIESKLREMDAIDINLESNDVAIQNVTNLPKHQKREKRSNGKCEKPTKIRKRRLKKLKDVDIDQKIKEGFCIVMRDLTKPMASKIPARKVATKNAVPLNSNTSFSGKKIKNRQEFMSEMEMLKDREMRRRCGKYASSKYRCESCIFTFPNKLILKEHNRKKHDKEAGEHECDICNVRFPMMKTMSRHRSTHYLRRNHSSKCYVYSHVNFFDVS